MGRVRIGASGSPKGILNHKNVRRGHVPCTMPQDDIAKEGKNGNGDEVQLDTGEELIRFRKRWWQFWIPAGMPPPPPESLDDAELIPFVNASFLSRLTYHWITPIMLLGYQRTLQATDLWKVGPEQESGYLAEKLDAAWAHRVKTAEEWNAGLLDGRNNPSRFLRVGWAVKGHRAVREKRWREADGQREASLAWALNDVFGRRFWIGGVFKVVADTGQLMGPVLVKAIINFAKARAAARETGDGLPSVGKGVGMALGLICVVLIASVSLHQFFHRSMVTGVAARAALTACIYKRSVRLTGKERIKLTNSKILNYISTDVSRIDACSQWFHAAWTAPIQVTICLIILLTQLGPSALAGFSLFIFIVPIQERIMARQLKTRGASMKFTDQRASVLLEVLGSMRVVKYFCYEVPFLKRIYDIRDNEIRGLRKIQHAQSANMAVAFSLPVLASTLAFVTYTRATSDFDIAVIFSSYSLFQLLRQPMMFLPRALSNIADARNALHRITHVFTAQTLDEAPFDIDPTQEYGLEAVDASFEWETALQEELKEKTKGGKGGAKKPKDDEDTPPFQVQNITMRIPRGSLTGIVGRVGSGKSSLIQGLIGEMRKIGGSLSFGGTVAYCPQTAWIQNATVRENVLFGKPFESDRYWRIMEAACLLPDLQLLPDSDLTEIGEKGINLSGGQRQRINIARALYFDTDIIIFDDPLSAVDANVGKALFQDVVLELVRQGKTVILVTHALHFLSQCDYIYTLEGGRIEEQGTYQQLISFRGEFARLDKEFGGENTVEEKTENLVTVTATVEELKEKSDRVAGTGKIEGKLITKERRSTGSVSWRIHLNYIQAAHGYLTVPLVILAILGMQACQILSSYTLVFWQANTFNKPFSFYQLQYSLLGVGQSISTLLMGLTIDMVSMTAARNLHNNSMRNILFAPMSYFDTIPLGRIISVFGKDTDTIDNSLAMSLRMTALVMSNMGSAIIIIAVLEHYFIIAAVVIGFGYNYFASFYRASSREIKRLDALLRSLLYAHLSESLTGLPTIRSYGEIPRFIERNKYLIDLQNRALYLTVTNQRWLAIRLDVCGAVMVFIVALFAVIGVSNISPAQIGLVLTYTTQLTQMCNAATRQTAELENYMNSVERVVHYSGKELTPQEAAYESDKEHKPPPEWPQEGRIEFKDVEMQYRPGLPKVLHGISMTIHAGEKIGVVGRTGAGKSSLALTLLRIVEFKGKILIDDVDISQIGLKDLRSNISIIPQEPILFSGTVRSVLDPFNKYDDTRLWDALRRSYLVDSGTSTPMDSESLSIEELVDKEDENQQARHRIDLDTVVEIDGANLSVGQRSLLSLARALVKDSKVVVLDEATASVDLRTDHQIQRTIQYQFKDKTLICIAHRLRTILSYDRILVLDAGKIVEFDTPLELFSQPSSIFRGLCEKSNITSSDIEKSILHGRV
ncbi:ABC protein [Mycena amicta]|nr:ABC protein [Mycena amicta]